MPYKYNPFTNNLDYYESGGGGSGDVVGPASSTDNHFVLFNGTTGKLIKDSGYSVVPETSGGTGQSTYTQGDLLYSDAPNSLAKLTPTARGNQPIWNGTDIVNFDPLNQVYMWDDFFSGILGNYNWSNTALSGGTIAQITSTSDHPGQLQLRSTTSTNTGRSFYLGGNSTIGGFVIGNGVIDYTWIIEIDTLSDGVDTYGIIVGMTDRSNVDLNPTAGVYFKYLSSTSINWLRGTAQGTSTETDSGTVVTTGWVNLRIVISADGTSAEFFVNGTSVGTNNTDMPTANIRPYCCIQKTVGSTQNVFNVDFFKLYHYMTSAR